jgi:hypothetical protein
MEMAMPRKMKTLSGSRMRFIWDCVRDRQPPAISWLHLAILCLALNQIIVSNFLGFDPLGAISRHPTENYGSWIHLCGGLTLIPLTLVFILIELRTRAPNPNRRGRKNTPTRTTAWRALEEHYQVMETSLDEAYRKLWQRMQSELKQTDERYPRLSPEVVGG